MKVILLKDVTNVGKNGAVINVANGYARNYLIPRKLAIMAIKSTLKFNENRMKVIEIREEKLRQAALTQAKELQAVTILIKSKVGEDDKLYGSVTIREIHEELKKQGYDVDRRKIIIPEPIKKVGIHTVNIKLHQEVTVHLKVEVQASEIVIKEKEKEKEKKIKVSAKRKIIKPKKDESTEAESTNQESLEEELTNENQEA